MGQRCAGAGALMRAFGKFILFLIGLLLLLPGACLLVSGLWGIASARDSAIASLLAYGVGVTGLAIWVLRKSLQG